MMSQAPIIKRRINEYCTYKIQKNMSLKSISRKANHLKNTKEKLNKQYAVAAPLIGPVYECFQNFRVSSMNISDTKLSGLQK